LLPCGSSAATGNIMPLIERTIIKINRDAIIRLIFSFENKWVNMEAPCLSPVSIVNISFMKPE
jgi:hypothetical protein